MANDPLSAVLRHVEKAVHGHDAAGRTDAQLLDSFLHRRDEGAFEALVQRHGPMVLGVCRRILRHTQDAEDAFQTVFLVLARKASSLRQGELLGNWLYGVAYRAALETRAARRRTREREVAAMPEPEVVDESAVWSDLRPILDRELNRLPEKYREAVVLCDLQGQTRREVARQLGIPEGTLSGRLTTARRILARRLARRGSVLSGGALAAVLSQGTAEASLPAALVASSTRAATRMSVVSARVAALTEGVMKTMLLGKLQSVTALLLAFLVAVGAGFAVLSARAPRPAGRDDGQPATPARPVVVQEDGIIRQVAWSTDGKTLATVGLTFENVWIKDDAGKDTDQGVVMPNMTLKLWDARTGKLRRSLGEERHTNIMATAFSPDGKTAAVAMLKLLARREQDARDRPKLQVRIVDARTWTLRYVVEQEGGVSALAFSPDGTRLAFGGRSRLTQDAAFVKLWDVANRKLIGSTEGSGFHVSHLAFSRDGKLLASGDMKGKVRLYSGLTGKSIWVLDGHTEYVSGVGFSPDGKTLVSASADRTLKLWDVDSGKRLRTLNTRTPVSALAFSRDGRQLATAGWVKAKQHEVLVWDTRTWAVKKSVPGQTVDVCALAFSPDGGTLALGGGNSVRFGPGTPDGRVKAPGEFKLIPLASLPDRREPADPRQQRRESTYSIRAVLRVMPPCNLETLSDDYQDVRVRKVTREFVELEVVVYPFNANAETIKANPNWKKDCAGMKEYLAPGITTNWDEPMRKDLLGELARDGIHPDRLTDKEVVEQVSRWLFKRSRQRNMFCTFYVGFPDGKPKVLPGLEGAFERDKGDPKWTVREQFEHELLGKAMFARKTYGTCTSAAIYQTTVLRALGIPTRMILCVPPADGSDPSQVEMLEKSLSHHRVRHEVNMGVLSGEGFTSHTFCEVFVGGRWRRLNYTTLGQNVLEQNYLGLMIKVHTFKDLSEAKLAETWGTRYAKGQRSELFPRNNPYRLLEVSDHFGRHARIPNPPVDTEHRHLTIEKVYWADSKEAPRDVRDLPTHAGKGDGRLFLHGAEWFENAGDYLQYKLFMRRADRRFVLRAKGRPDVACQLSMGFVTNSTRKVRELEVIIPPAEYARMARGVAYTLHPVNGKKGYEWKVREGVTVTRE